MTVVTTLEGDVKQLKGYTDLYRLHIGDLCILFVSDGMKIIQSLKKGSITGLINNALVTVSIVYRGDLIRIFLTRNAGPTEVRNYYEQLEKYLKG